MKYVLLFVLAITVQANAELPSANTMKKKTVDNKTVNQMYSAKGIMELIEVKILNASTEGKTDVIVKKDNNWSFESISQVKNILRKKNYFVADGDGFIGISWGGAINFAPEKNQHEILYEKFSPHQKYYVDIIEKRIDKRRSLGLNNIKLYFPISERPFWLDQGHYSNCHRHPFQDIMESIVKPESFQIEDDDKHRGVHYAFTKEDVETIQAYLKLKGYASGSEQVIDSRSGFMLMFVTVTFN